MSRTPNTLDFTLPLRLFSSSSTVLKCIDCHAAGEPARVVLSGVPTLPSSCTSALLKREYMKEHLDHFRKILLFEPRGYPCQNVNFVFSADSRGSEHLQFVIGEQNQIYPLMSGHNTICVATALLECGVVRMEEPKSTFTLESPAGPINIVAKCSQGKATSIALRNAPSFVEKLDIVVRVPHGVGPVKLDIAYGGMWYAIVDLKQFEKPEFQHLDMRLEEDNASQLCRVGEMIKVACREQFPVQHPTEDYPGVDILAFRGETVRDATGMLCSRNTVVMSNGVLDWNRPETWTAMLDRSPCGTGTCAIMAVMHARGLLKLGEAFVHESIVGTKFTGTVLDQTTVGERPAIIPQIEGSAYITQYSEVVLDESDPFPHGYRMADIW